MTEVSLSSSVPISPDKVWELIGGFNALPDWHPAVEKSELEEDGSVRRLTLMGGGSIVERLEKMDEGSHCYEYSIVESPLPVSNYKSRLELVDDGKGGTKINWSSEFVPSGASETDASKVIEGIYTAGFENLKKMFGG